MEPFSTHIHIAHSRQAKQGRERGASGVGQGRGGELYLTGALGGRPVASGRGDPRRLVTSGGCGWADDVQSHRPETKAAG
jgi:hypothetical protein